MENSKIFVISDTHFNHTNIIKYCNRPFETVEEMNKTIVDNWNSVVSDNDYVYCLGDFCLGGKEIIKDFCSQLKGHKILVKGNHDHGTNTTYKEAGFEQVYGENLIVRFDHLDKTIHFSHHRKAEEETHYLNLYGHVHDKPSDDETHKCVCVELWNYTPVLLDELIK